MARAARAATHTVWSEGSPARHCSAIRALHHRRYWKTVPNTTSAERLQEGASMNADNTPMTRQLSLTIPQKHRSTGCSVYRDHANMLCYDRYAS
jgi:hypothetical protein